MQAITTKYIGPTNTKGSRVKATTESGVSITLSWDSSLNSDENHVRAAKRLCSKMDWLMDGEKLIGGHIEHGMVFVFLRGAVEVEL